VREVSIVATAFDVGRMELVLAPVKEGSTTKTLAVTLRKNALVRAFDVVITAASATEVAAGVAGQIRTTSKDGGKTSIVVDFGALRSVAAISLPQGIATETVNAWIGTRFQFTAAFSPSKRFASLPSEIRTERIEVIVTGSVDS